MNNGERDDLKQGHTVTRGNLENDDAFSFFVESSFSGNGVVLNRARHDDIDDAYENMNNRFLDILRTSLMDMPTPTCMFSMGFVQITRNDGPCVEQDEHHYERKEEPPYKQQFVQENCMIFESNVTYGSNQYCSKKRSRVCGDIVSDLDAE